MNKIYKLKYDRRRNQLVAVSELTTGAGKEATGSVAGECGLQGASTFRRLLGILTPLAVLTGLVIGMLPGLALANPDLPVGGQVVAGQGSISTSGNQMTIHQGTHGLVTNWHSFDIGQNHTVQFVQPDSSAVALNRVTGGHESQILGTLTANGQVMLINPAGVMFGKGARVNTAGLLASTKNISTEDFMAGRYTFSGGSHPGAEIVNQGSLTTTKGGYIVLAADRVRNSGTLSTPSGKTVLAAADRVTLQLDNTGLASVSVNGSVVNALVENSGLIAATNGQVYLTARGKEMLLNTVVNNSGTVEARGLNHRGGEIVLDGGESGVVSQSGMLLADSETGRGGKITVQGTNIHLAGGSRTSATGRTGGGGVYVGGGWQGKDAAIRNASKVVMDRDAVIDVSATEKGDGGKAVLWSEDYTNFRGRILAKGGAQSGNGGQVETSSHHNLQAFGDVEASALNGRGGNWLLDPEDIKIINGTGNATESSGEGGIFTPGSGASSVSNATIEQRLNNGTSVTIKTAKEGSDTGSGGNITFESSISKTAGSDASLTLDANGSINITNHNITSTKGKLNVNLYAAGSKNGNILLNNASITTNGGDITLGQWVENGATNTNKLGVSITGGSVLNAATASSPADTDGNITLTANNDTTLSEATLTGNNITVNVSNATGDALTINGGSNLTAATNLTVTGETNGAGNNYGIHTWNGSRFQAGNTVALTGRAESGGGDGAFNSGGITVSAPNVVITGASGANQTSSGSNIASGIKGGTITNTLSGGNLTLNGTANGSGATGVYLANASVSTNGTGNLTVNGNSSRGVGVNLNTSTLTGGNVTVTGTSGSSNNNTGKGLDIAGSNLNATTGNLSLTGRMNGGAVKEKGGFGVHIHGGNTFTAAENITVNGSAMDGTNGGLNVNGGTFSAKNTVLNGQSDRNNIGVKAGSIITVTQGNLSITGTANRINSAPGVTGLVSDGALNISVQNGSLNITGNVNDTGHNATSANTSVALNLSAVNLTASNGSVSLNADMNGSTAGNAMILSGGNITAGENIALNGAVTGGTGSGVSLSGTSMTASSGNISVNGAGVDSNNGALHLTGNNNFSAQNTTLSGNAGRNNIGTLLSGNLNVTTGNLSVAGVTHHFNNDAKNAYRGLKADGLALDVSNGNLTLSGQSLAYDGVGPQTGGTAGLELKNSTLKANHAAVSGSSVDSGSGFILNNVTLNGGIAQGNNMTFSSNGSAANVTNTLNVNGGLGYGAFESLQKAGIDNNTSIGALTASLEDMKKYMNFSDTSDWEFNADSLNTSAAAGKAGSWSVTGLTGINASTSGNISLTGLNLTDSNLTGSSLTLQGANNASLTLQNTDLNATSGNVSLSANVATGNALVLSGGNITAGENINLNGTATGGTGTGVSLTDVNMTASSGNISVNGTGFDANNGALYVSGGNFAAKNTVMEGTANRNNVGAKLAGNINVTQGNLSVTGNMYHRNNGAFTGLLAQSGLNIDVSDGDLALTGQALQHPDVTDGCVSVPSGNVVGLNLSGATLSANHADLKGVSALSGSGFILNNVTLNGGIARGNNMTFSSNGSAANVTNTLNVNGGLGYGAFQKIHQAGIDNNTSVLVTADAEELALMGFKNNSDWTFNASQAGEAAGGKAGMWGLLFTGINATTSGNITLTGMNLTNSNLTGSSLTMQGANNASLTVQNTNLTASSGNASLISDGTISLSGGNVQALQGSVNVQAGGVNGTAGGNALTVSNVNFSSQNGTTLSGLSAQNGAGVKLNGAINVTAGNLTVNGTTTRVNNATEVRGIDARNTKISVSGTDAVLSMTGTVNGDTDATQAQSVVGLDLSGTSTALNASSANLTGVSTGKGMGFMLNASLSDSLKSTTGNNLTLSSKGSDGAVHNYIGNRVDDALIKHLIDNNTHIGSKTEVQRVDIYQTELKKYIEDNKASDDLVKDFGDWILSFTGINVSKTGNISFTGASFSNSNLTAGGNLTLDNGPGNLSLSGINLTAKNGYVNLTGGSGINLTNGNISANNDITINASHGGVTISGTGSSNDKLANVSSTAGNISIYGGEGSVSLRNANLTASNGFVSLYALNNSGANPRSDALSLYHTSISAKNNISIKSESTTLTAIYGDTSNFHSENGSILVNGIGRNGGYTYGTVAFTNSNFQSGHNISITGQGINPSGTLMSGGLYVGGNVTFTAENTILKGSNNNGSTSPGNTVSAGVVLGTAGGVSDGGNITVNGNLTVDGQDVGAGPGVYIHANLTVTGVADIGGKSAGGDGVGFGATPEYDGVRGFEVHNNINISGGGHITGYSEKGSGISSAAQGNTINITTGAGNSLIVSGQSVSGSGALLAGSVENVGGGDVLFAGSSEIGDGVRFAGNASVSGMHINGSTVTGNGVNISGNLTSSNNSISGNASGNGSGVLLNGNVNGDITENNVITGHSAQGNGLLVSGESTATNVTLNGDTVDGNGIKVTGNLTANNVSANGNASGAGNGINLAGNVSGGQWHGDAAGGTGVNVTGNSALTNVSLSGTTEYGTGVNVPGSLTSEGTTTVTGNATGNGTGAAVSGTLNGDIYGSSTSGTGAAVNGTINGTVNGTSTSGTGAVVGDGANISQGSQVNGQSGTGTGSVTEGNVTNQGSISGQSDRGTGTALGGNLSGNGLVTGTTNGPGDGVNLSGNVSGGVVTGHADNGTGVNISGNSTLTNVSVNGSTLHGTGVNVSGNLTNTGNTEVSGNTSAGGTGVHINQGSNVTGGSLSGTSVSGLAVVIDGNNTLTGTTVNGSSGSGNGLVLTGTVNNNGSTLNGQSGSGDGVNLNGTVTGGNLNAYSGSGVGLHITGDTWLKYVNTTYRSDTGIPLLIDGLLSFVGGTLNGVPQGDQAAERHHLWLLQPPREQTSGPEQLMRTAGWQARDVPVGVDICTDGEETVPCRRLDAGMRDRPSHP
ncbi:TPA: ESPR-type extended signal peptide-containing protein [Salmonella enterica subsp. enterica serovar Kottbus]